MITIRNTNEYYGDPVEFTADTLKEAVAQMQETVRQCGEDFADIVVTEDDYEVLEVPAEHWYQDGWPQDITADTTDEQLAVLMQREQHAIDEADIVVSNLAVELRMHRDDLREQRDLADDHN